MTCDQCSAAMINGIFCHEQGCPNTGARYDRDAGEWVRGSECSECGDFVPRGECCNCMEGDDA